ncbi:hypothetical protein CTEN210_03927 [Chaetoceros tenuissimus]|uniref:Uncharacterized protein n=1 Tax=Chaetoceros tenuissimus TaxID=426638 RepID=A0AAD3CK07_9STRA|nr:hypothetical protein CTEN210_03927 [Chaetoceros tenuissimus]
MTNDLQYIDEAGFKQFDSFQGRMEVHIQKDIACPDVGKVFDEWIEHVWKSFKVLQEGSGRGQANGCLREVPGKIQEKILSVGEPLVVVDADDSKSSELDSKAPSILYKVVSGPFPATDHIGLVTLIPKSSSSTVELRWESKFEPSMIGNLFCCGGAGMRIGIEKYLGGVADEFASRFG